jgi:sigma-E factor negative regulatory protein RseA
MTREISELMDGELDPPAAGGLLAGFKGSPGLDQDWALYHLIGDTIRQQAFYSPRLLEHVAARLAAEPAILAPRARPARERALGYAAVAAASVAVVAVVAWVGFQGTDEAPAPRTAAVQESAVASPASVPMPTGVNDYLLAHQEYSPSSVVQGVVPYVRTVSLDAGAAGR